MRHTNWRFPYLALVLLSSGLCCYLWHTADGSPKALAQNKVAARKGDSSERHKALLEVSRKGYEESMDTYRQTQRSGQSIKPWVNVDQVYTWSLRWLRADSSQNDK